MITPAFITTVKFKKDKKNKNKGTIIISPCYPGYGTTLGNALRRVLLSSLSGAAVTAVKIKGVRHEFSAIPGVKEDALQIILNLKQLHLSLFSDEPVVLELRARGERVVKARDITAHAQVKIVNPDLPIATLTDKKTTLQMKIWVENGRGYQPSEEKSKDDLEVNTILIDSIFNPVLAVNFKTENIRVGKKTNYDQIVLEVETDGTITPQNTFIEATKILSEQFSSLLLIAQSINKKDGSQKEIKKELLSMISGQDKKKSRVKSKLGQGRRMGKSRAKKSKTKEEKRKKTSKTSGAKKAKAKKTKKKK